MKFFEICTDDRFREVEFAEGTDWEGIVCPENDGHKRPGQRIGNLKIEIKGKKTGDVLWTFLSEYILTDRVVHILKENGITGYDLKPVDVVKGSVSEKLWELVVTGWAGMAPKKSGIELIDSCKYCGYLVYSSFQKPEYIIDENQWDGSDIFMVWPLPRFVFVTERVAELLSVNKIKGVKIKSIEQLSVNKYSSTLSPGRLSYYMPKSRAKKLGEPYGID